MKGYKRLTYTDRMKIEAWERVGTPVKIMARELNVHISTVYRELKRGRYDRLNSDLTTKNCYSPDISEKRYRENLRAKGAGLKIGKDYEYAAYLEYKVSKEGYSPGAILGEIKRKGPVFNTTISETTFYRYIDNGVFLTITNKSLPVKRNKVKHKYKHVRPSRAPKGKSIEKRPKEIDTRETFGHWEMDCVEGKKGTKKTLLVLTERKTRYEIVCLMKDKTAASVVKALNNIEQKYGTKLFTKVFKTITVDNGSEFSDYEGLEKSCKRNELRTQVYYCHPYSSFERGSNENQNRLVRRHYPKGFNFTKVSIAEIHKLEKWINNYPRKMFEYYSSSDLFEACMNNLQIAE